MFEFKQPDPKITILIQNDDTHHVPCFFLSSNFQIEVKRFCGSDSNNNIIVNDSTCIRKKQVNFDRKTLYSKTSH